MQSNNRISELLVEVQGYRDLEVPVLFTSGEPGKTYVNTEKLVLDNGKWTDYGNNACAMITHSLHMAQKYPTFQEVVTILSEQVKPLLRGDTCLISGGQRRDWLFSGPVAYELGLPHIALYKDGRHEVITFNGRTAEVDSVELQGGVAVHVADLLTKGSSYHNGKRGWILTLRNEGIEITDAVNVVTRLEGGEETLRGVGVQPHSVVAINESFIGAYSTVPKTALAYARNPRAWNEGYIREQGIDCFVNAFAEKPDRAKKFLERYYDVLESSGRLRELEQKVNEQHGIDIMKL